MYINKLFLKEFGKFNNKEIKLSDGINVIYGDTNSGKSTIRDFVTGILFGMDKTRGLGESGDMYQRRKPQVGNGYFGKAYVTHEGKSHLLERNFDRATDGARLTEIETGKEERLKTKNSYRGVLFDMDRSTYVDALSIPPVSEKLSDKEIAADLENYLRNMKDTGSSRINKQAAIEYLENERKKYDNQKYLLQMEELEAKMDALGDVEGELADIRQERRDELDSYNMEIARLKREARQLINEADAAVPDEDEDRERSRIFLEVEVLDEDVDAKKKNKEDKKDKKFTDNIFVILATGMAVVAIITALVHFVGFQDSIQKLFTICTIAFVAITIIDGLFRKGVFDGDKLPTEEEFQRTVYEMGRATESRTVKVEVDRVFQEEHDKKLDMLKFQEHDALEKRAVYNELKEKRDEIFVDYDELETEKKAIDLAIDTIKNLSGDIGRSFENLEKNISKILGVLSKGEYNEIKFDENMHVAVKKDEHFFRVEFLGREVLRQVYLAVRLAVAKALNQEKLPLVIDDEVCVSQGVKFQEVLEVIGENAPGQILILTSDKALAKSVRESERKYNLVVL